MIPQLQDVSYEERLSVLALLSLLHPYLRGDLIMLHKFLMVTSILIFPICTLFQPHQPGDTI